MVDGCGADHNPKVGMSGCIIPHCKGQIVFYCLPQLVRSLQPGNHAISPDIKSIKNLVVGTWSNPAQPVVLEFRNVCFGSFNQLDGLELDL